MVWVNAWVRDYVGVTRRTLIAVGFVLWVGVFDTWVCEIGILLWVLGMKVFLFTL